MSDYVWFIVAVTTIRASKAVLIPPRAPVLSLSRQGATASPFGGSNVAEAERSIAIRLASHGRTEAAALVLASLKRTLGSELGDVENEVGQSPLVELLGVGESQFRGDNAETFRWCLHQGCDPQPLVHDDRPLWNPELLQLALEDGARPDVVDADQRTPRKDRS